MTYSLICISTYTAVYTYPPIIAERGQQRCCSTTTTTIADGDAPTRPCRLLSEARLRRAAA